MHNALSATVRYGGLAPDRKSTIIIFMRNHFKRVVVDVSLPAERVTTTRAHVHALRRQSQIERLPRAVLPLFVHRLDPRVLRDGDFSAEA